MSTPRPLPPHFSQPLLKTPFHERARALSQVDSFIPWAGYTTVDVFTTVEQEYFAIRNATTLYDLTPMVKYRVSGPDALPYLNRLVTRDVAKLKLDRVAYCVWCNDYGHVHRRRHGISPRRERLPIVHGRTTNRLAARFGHRLRRRGERSHRTDRGTGAAGADLVRGAEVARSERGRAAEAFRDRSFCLRLPTVDGVAHRVHRRLGLRAVDAPGSGGANLGCTDGGRTIARDSADRLAGAQYGAHRSRLLESQCRLRLGRTDDSHRSRPLAAGAWARLAGRFRQGSLHRPASAAGRAAQTGRAASWSARRRRQQAGPQCAAVRRGRRASAKSAA